MTPIAYIFTMVITLIYLILSVVFGELGLSYMDPSINSGLHPAIAFPLAIVMLAIAGLCPLYISRCYSRDAIVRRDIKRRLAAL